MKVTGITATPATALMKKLKEAELIEPVRNREEENTNLQNL